MCYFSLVSGLADTFQERDSSQQAVNYKTLIWITIMAYYGRLVKLKMYYTHFCWSWNSYQNLYEILWKKLLQRLKIAKFILLNLFSLHILEFHRFLEAVTDGI